MCQTVMTVLMAMKMKVINAINMFISNYSTIKQVIPDNEH